MTHPLDVDAIRAHFPALDGGTAYFDGPGGSQTPTVVADAIRDAMVRPLSNRGNNTAAERNAEEIVVQCRLAIGELLNADPDAVIFGRSMTALTFDLSRTLSAQWRPGDEIVVTRLDHDANVRPWVLAAARAGAEVRWVDFDPATSELPVENVEAALSDRTRLVAITAASNLIGTMPDVKNHRGAHPCGRRPAVRRRRALHRPRRRRLPRSRRRLLRVLAVQVPWPALWRGRRQARRPRRPPARQTVTRSRSGAGTLRTRHPALRTDGRHDRCRRLPRRHDACHRLPARPAARRHDRAGAPRGRASATDRGRPATAPHGHRPLPRCAPDADVARDLCRARPRRSAPCSHSTTSTRPPVRSTPTRRRGGSGCPRMAVCGSAWRPTTPRPTSTVSSTCWRRPWTSPCDGSPNEQAPSCFGLVDH